MPFILLQNSPTERSPFIEGRVELESAELGVAEELPLERQPGLSCGAAVSPDDVLQI